VSVSSFAGRGRDTRLFAGMEHVRWINARRYAHLNIPFSIKRVPSSPLNRPHRSLKIWEVGVLHVTEIVMSNGGNCDEIERG
jgi:hypothetical protein